MTQHTPTPWEVRQDKEGQFAYIVPADKTIGGAIACLIHPDDAAFIVRAANAHKELVRALRGIILADTGSIQERHDARVVARAALAAAEKP